MRFKIIVAALFLVLAYLIWTSVLNNENMLSVACEIANSNVKNFSTAVIDTSVEDTIKDMGVESGDFIIKDYDGNISIDTMLINRFCSDISINIMRKSVNLSEENIYVPIGAIWKTTFLANSGPKIKYTLLPNDDIAVDYETQFISAGINQTNFKIWINVKVGLEIINPIAQRDMEINRKIMLVDTIIKGEVPKGYMEIKK